MDTSQLRRTNVAALVLAAALTLLTALGAPTAGAARSNAFGAHADHGDHSAVLDIGLVVAMRKAAAAQYYVDHALELNG